MLLRIDTAVLSKIPVKPISNKPHTAGHKNQLAAYTSRRGQEKTSLSIITKLEIFNMKKYTINKLTLEVRQQPSPFL